MYSVTEASVAARAVPHPYIAACRPGAVNAGSAATVNNQPVSGDLPETDVPIAGLSVALHGRRGQRVPAKTLPNSGHVAVSGVSYRIADPSVRPAQPVIHQRFNPYATRVVHPVPRSGRAAIPGTGIRDAAIGHGPLVRINGDPGQQAFCNTVLGLGTVNDIPNTNNCRTGQFLTYTPSLLNILYLT